MELGENRLGNFSFHARRVIVGIALLPCLLSVINLYLKWGLFGHLDTAAVAVCFIALFLVMRYLGPTVREVKKHREAIRGSRT